ncbi:porin [Aquabacterium sp. J223]|uniref:porin n=1 Tax=Aquabacterium sp. J223 TaxID=2898431 RepID=UPI0021AD5FA9|nr:porin [Aquabacterium sp. J223]UUX94014.1 porin [Aquabacterium sp. J223]
MASRARTSAATSCTSAARCRLSLAAQETNNNAFGKSAIGDGSTPAVGLFSPGFDGQRSYLVGGAYDFGVAKLFAQYGVVETKVTGPNPEWKIASIGAAVPLGGGKILAQYSHKKRDDLANGPTSKIATVGYDYNLSKRTDAYAVYMNDKYTNLSTGNTFMVGVRHKF